MRIQGLAEVVLNVRDRAASLAFYRDVLGLVPISDVAAPGPIFLRAGPEQLGIPQLIVLVPLEPNAAPFNAPRTLHHLALTVAPADFDTASAELAALGCAIRTGQHPVLPSRTLYVDDPDGNEVELICRAV